MYSTTFKALVICHRWFCHVDDDNYLNPGALLSLLTAFPGESDIYVGKPSLDRPMRAQELLEGNKTVSIPLLFFFFLNWIHCSEQLSIIIIFFYFSLISLYQNVHFFPFRDQSVIRALLLIYLDNSVDSFTVYLEKNTVRGVDPIMYNV